MRASVRRRVASSSRSRCFYAPWASGMGLAPSARRLGKAMMCVPCWIKFARWPPLRSIVSPTD